MYDVNTITISGEITVLESFKTKKGIFAMNIRLKSVGRYINIISCVVYGSLAELINKKLKIGSLVIITGRLMNFPSEDQRIIPLKVVIEKISEEIFVPQEIIQNRIKNNDSITNRNK